MEKLKELYINFMLSSFGKIEVTKLEEVLDKRYSHDKFTRMLLNTEVDDERVLWQQTKSLLRDYENEDDGCILIDDTILDKPYTKENEINCWHYDHSVGRSVKGIGMLNFHYSDKSEISIPLGYEIITKSESHYDEKSKRVRRKSLFSKNEIMQDKLEILTFHNEVKYRYILADKWFASSENMAFIDKVLQKKFIFPIKKNRTVALSLKDKINGKYVSIADIDTEGFSSRLVYLKGCDKPFKLLKQVEKNINDDEPNYLYLLTNDIDLTSQKILEIYKRRWKIEEYHKSLKQNLKIEHSPTRVEASMRSHIHLAVTGFIKLEKLRLQHKMNHFALKEKIYIEALKSAFEKIQDLETA
jgi:hypothetical protein